MLWLLFEGHPMQGQSYNSLSDVEMFVKVAASGNFSEAAKVLNMAPSSISKFMIRLEKRLGVRLMHRTTRRVVLTSEGQLYYHRGIRILADINETERLMSAHQKLPAGKVRITCSVPFSLHQLIPILPGLNAINPNIEITLQSTDAIVDLLAERCDIAIRIGKLRDSTLKARKLATSKMIIVASPEYLKKYGTPKKETDLVKHQCLNFYGNPGLNRWLFKKNAWTATGLFSGDNGESIRAMALASGGIARLSAYMIGNDIKEGRLIPLLQKSQANYFQEIYLLHAGNISARVKFVIDYIFKKLGDKVFTI